MARQYPHVAIYIIGFIVGLAMVIVGFISGMDCFNNELIIECSNKSGWIFIVGGSLALVSIGGWITHKLISRKASN